MVRYVLDEVLYKHSNKENKTVLSQSNMYKQDKVLFTYSTLWSVAKSKESENE